DFTHLDSDKIETRRRNLGRSRKFLRKLGKEKLALRTLDADGLVTAITPVVTRNGVLCEFHRGFPLALTDKGLRDAHCNGKRQTRRPADVTADLTRLILLRHGQS